MSDAPLVLMVSHSTVPLDGEVICGRGLSCDLVISGDPKVSRMHAKFVTDGSHVTVEDLGSANGVYVNGARVAGQTRIGAGDVVRIGDQRISVVPADRAGRARTNTRPEGTSAVRPGEIPRSSDERLTEPYGIDRYHMRWLQIEDAIAKREWDLASELLRAQIARVIEDTTASGRLQPATQEKACRHALDLAFASGDGSWLDGLFELHIVARRPLPSVIAAHLPSIVHEIPGIDVSILEKYVDVLRIERSSFSATERQLCGTIETALLRVAPSKPTAPPKG